ncbi:MAG: NUDIX domain-containing protein [Pseudanabaenales cyanobacterium]|nr:NUDIX domain-containing protein [Pseudanabaenales cyanobacterium]
MILSQELKRLIDELIAQSYQDGIQKFVVGAVIKRGYLILLLKRNEDDFMGGLVELPSGSVEAEESLIEALGREIYEETGLSMTDVVQFLGTFDYISRSGRNVRQFNFLVVDSEGTVKLSKGEHSEYYWVLPKDINLGLYNISEQTREIIGLIDCPD